jgi:hypothetical protein
MCGFAVAANRPNSVSPACLEGMPFRAREGQAKRIFRIWEVECEKLQEVI